MDLTHKEKVTLEKAKEFFKKYAGSFKWIVVIALGVGLANVGSYYITNSYQDESGDVISDSDDYSDGDCTVKAIELHGELLTYIPPHSENDTYFNYDVISSDLITNLIREANDDEDIKAIMIEVDSGGGSGVAGEEISNAIKNSEKPVVAFIREIGASASYWAVSGADKIFASKNSSVGSIGVTSSFLSAVEKDRKEGYVFEQLSVGKFKDTGNYEKPMTDEERDLIMRDINIMFDNFVETISKNRNMSIEEVKAFADGSTVMGERAKSLGMIDEIGGMIEVEKYLEGVLGEEPTVCW